ncbi:hypothetical protein [Oryza sativa Japonica Group]|uniref:Uncharacterized protein n=1 Tax=Oryza sativa subsp. japonica TaxID=39947 RepID=Q5VQF5_ORYSJ|nr:hypothetical protein [Oryza sativa Japonica Group]
MAAFSSNSGDLLFFSGIGDTLDSNRGPYGEGGQSGRVLRRRRPVVAPRYRRRGRRRHRDSSSPLA